MSEPVTDARKLLEGLACRLRQRAKGHRSVGGLIDPTGVALDIVADEIEHLLRERVIPAAKAVERRYLDPSISPRDSPAQLAEKFREAVDARDAETHECRRCHRLTRNTTVGCDYCGPEDS